MSNVLIIGGHGMGDCLMAFQCAAMVYDHGIVPKVFISARDEVYEPLHRLFDHKFSMEKLDESYAYDNNILKDESLFQHITKGYKYAYYVIPDLLFNNKYAFDFKKFSTHPQMIKARRLLDRDRQSENSIYLGLMSTTPGYTYSEPMALALSLANTVKTHTIHFPIITKWAGKEIKHIDIPAQLPDNLKVYTQSTLGDSINVLRKCQYFVGTDNGPSHIAYHMGMPRLLLDPQFSKLPWIARWREDLIESIPIHTSVEEVTGIVDINISTPQTTLVPRMSCLINRAYSWENLLLLKTQ